MFKGFANVWTPVLPAKRVKAKPVPVTLAGEKLVLFRGKDGEVGALLDACPHRSVALSLGKVNKDGCLECPFHGWRFDTKGENTHVPLNPNAKRDMLFATRFPTRVIGDFVWVYTAPGKTAPVEPQVPDALTNTSLGRAIVSRTWRAHWTRVMENMLDSPHLPFVHRTTIGRGMRTNMTEQSEMLVTWEEQPFGGRQRSSLDGGDAQAHLDFYQPNMMALHIPIPNKHFRMHALVVPVDEHHTTLWVVGTRDFMRSPLVNPFYNLMNGYIADQDRAVVESSPDGPVPPAGQERSVATDRATLQFRKYYFERLHDSSARLERAGPVKAA